MPEKKKFSVVIQSDAYKNLINNTLGNKEVARKFVAEVSTVVAQNKALGECEPATIISAALLAQTLNLPIAPTLGYAYVIPYKNKGVAQAQFQIGWKGLVQLAQRSGQYKRLGVRPVHEGEYKGQDEFGDDEFAFSHDYDDKPIVGYFAYLELVNGFKKTVYWTKAQCEKHAKQYSQAYRNGYSSKWKDEFDAMACKTVLKQLLSKWGVMATEMNTALQADQSIVSKDLDKFDYVDNEEAEDDAASNISVPEIPTDEDESEEVVE